MLHKEILKHKIKIKQKIKKKTIRNKQKSEYMKCPTNELEFRQWHAKKKYKNRKKRQN